MEKTSKLVRDRIPEIIEANGETPIIRIAEDKEYFNALIDKLHEEVDEYKEAYDPKELIDVMEVIHALSESHKISINELENMRKEKAEERGRFTKKIILEKTE